jgi:hypothetical protein
VPGSEGIHRQRPRLVTSTQGKVGDPALSGPPADSLGAQVAVRFRETIGYVDNLTLGRAEPRQSAA